MPQVTLALGQSKQITMTSAGTMASMFAGQQLTAVFRTSDDQEVQAIFSVKAKSSSSYTPPPVGDPNHNPTEDPDWYRTPDLEEEDDLPWYYDYWSIPSYDDV